MALAILTISCILFYATSRYFPLEDPRILGNKRSLIWVASVLSLLSLFLLYEDSDLATALMVWSIALMTLLSGIILSLKINLRWIWVWTAICFLFILIDLS